MNLQQIKSAMDAQVSNNSQPINTIANVRALPEEMGSLVLLADMNSYVYRLQADGQYTNVITSDMRQAYGNIIKFSHKGLANPEFNPNELPSNTNKKYIEPFIANRYKPSDPKKQVVYYTAFSDVLFNGEQETRTLAMRFFFAKGTDLQELLSYNDYERIATRVENCSISLI